MGMTEDLWYHALKFLDRYRTDVRHYDISELYEFADETGILERHKQMLAQPFQDSQVDMKIMYYELIRMLIDYERKNHPETYDATKTVGKIEGYQELTNKLQRYLNQRFIEDINGLMKGQESITNMFGGSTVNISQKFEQLEQNYSSFEEKHQTLQQNFTIIENMNNSLLERVTLLENREAELKQNLLTTATELKMEKAERELLLEQHSNHAKAVTEQLTSQSSASASLASRLESQEEK